MNLRKLLALQQMGVIRVMERVAPIIAVAILPLVRAACLTEIAITVYLHKIVGLKEERGIVSHFVKKIFANHMVPAVFCRTMKLTIAIQQHTQNATYMKDTFMELGHHAISRMAVIFAMTSREVHVAYSSQIHTARF